MANVFEAAVPSRVVFGRGRLHDAGGLIREWGGRIVLFTGANPDRAAPLLSSLAAAGCTVETLTAHGEPTFDLAREYAGRVRGMRPDAVVAFGGGSVIDTAKAVAMLATNGGDPLDYAEVIGRGLPVVKPPLPFAAVPTTAGAGAEATKNAVLIEPSKKAKVSLRSPLMIPRLVVIDPETTVSLPPDVTAATGMDALCQLIEAFVTKKANPFTDALCRAGIPRAASAIRRVCSVPGDLDAREDMALAAWWSGVALANAGLGAVHGFAAALGGLCDAPHGLICARMLAPAAAANLEALRRAGGDGTATDRFREIAVMVTGCAAAQAEDGIVWMSELAASLPLKRLADFGVDRLDRADVTDAAMRSSSMKGNPVELTHEAAAAVFDAALAG